MSAALGLAHTTVLFDWNGTVVLDADRARLALGAVLERRGLRALDAAAFRHRFRLPLAELFVGLGVALEEATDAEREWNAAMASTPARLRVGAIAAFERMAAAGVRLGIVSAAESAAVDFDRASLQVPDVWSIVETSVADKQAVLRRSRGDRTLAWYVGDTPYDMECAASAGFVPIGVSGGYTSTTSLRRAGATVVIDGLDELLPLLSDAEATAVVHRGSARTT